MRKPKFNNAEMEIIKAAREAGKISYSNGQPQTPAQNPDFMEMITKNPLPIGTLSIERMKAFVSGWTCAAVLA